MLMNLLLLLLFLTAQLTSARKEPLKVAFMPSPGNFETLPTFVKLGEIFTSLRGETCTAIVHSADRTAWDKSSCSKVKYGFGEGERQTYLESLYKAQNLFEARHPWSAEHYRETFEIIIKQFHDAKVLEALKRMDINLLVCDASNFLCNYAAQNLEGVKVVYHAPAVPSYYLRDYFETSASYHPVMTSPYTNIMNIRQRFFNYVRDIFLARSIKHERKLFAEILKHNEHQKINMHEFIDPISLFTTQSVKGFNYPLYTPPNLAYLGCVSCLLPHQLPITLDKFLARASKNIYIKLDRIESPDILKNIIDTVEELRKIGFVISVDLPLGLKLPGNLHKIDYIPTADLLADERISAIIHDNDWSCILEAVYYHKPMIGLGYIYERKANGAFIEDRGVGISADREKEMTKDRLVQSIKEIVDPKKDYIATLEKYSKILMTVNSTKVAEKVFEDYVTNGIEHLVVKPFYEMPSYSYYNLDVWFVLVGLPLILFSCLCFQCKRLRKPKRRPSLRITTVQSQDTSKEKIE